MLVNLKPLGFNPDESLLSDSKDMELLSISELISRLSKVKNPYDRLRYYRRFCKRYDEGFREVIVTNK